MREPKGAIGFEAQGYVKIVTNEHRAVLVKQLFIEVVIVLHFYGF
jgi:hypothetical protein